MYEKCLLLTDNHSHYCDNAIIIFMLQSKGFVTEIKENEHKLSSCLLKSNNYYLFFLVSYLYYESIRTDESFMYRLY